MQIMQEFILQIFGKENPVKAPQICMILRKHLQGAKLLEISQVRS